MEDIWETNGRKATPEPINETHSIKDRLARLEDNAKYGKMKSETLEKEQEWKLPFKWKREANKSLGKQGEDKVLVIYLNIKGEFEPPKLVPLYSGNIIIWKNKAYEFDPRATWTHKVGKKIYKVVILREIDRRPVSNLDWDEVKKRGDSTDSDEILVKMVTKAFIEKQKTKVNAGAIIMIVIVVIAVIAFFMFFKG